MYFKGGSAPLMWQNTPEIETIFCDSHFVIGIASCTIAMWLVMLVSLRESVKYTQETMKEAVQRVKDLKADLGGTEILRPLFDIYKAPSILGHPLQVSFGLKLIEKKCEIIH